jgi:hypothetical protein
LLEHDAFLREPVQVRCNRVAVSVRADTVCAGRVEGDDEDVEIASRSGTTSGKPPHASGDCASASENASNDAARGNHGLF